jgi:hypothetical protein
MLDHVQERHPESYWSPLVALTIWHFEYGLMMTAHNVGFGVCKSGLSAAVAMRRWWVTSCAVSVTKGILKDKRTASIQGSCPVI